MTERLVTPDVVALVLVWLAEQLPTIPDQSPVPVIRVVPNPRPARFVTVRLLGGTGRDDPPVTDRVAVTVEAWADTVEAAHDLAQNARAVIHTVRGAALAGTQIYRVIDHAAPIELPDPVSDQARVTFTVELTVRTRRT